VDQNRLCLSEVDPGRVAQDGRSCGVGVGDRIAQGGRDAVGESGNPASPRNRQAERQRTHQISRTVKAASAVGVGPWRSQQMVGARCCDLEEIGTSTLSIGRTEFTLIYRLANSSMTIPPDQAKVN
jgi:hypothetical protein